MIAARDLPPDRFAAGREPRVHHGVANLVGASRAIQDVRTVIEKVARSRTATVLARGESGTGKARVARAIHAESARTGKPFVNVTCAALEDTHLERELFGDEEDAADASAVRRGLLELADGGTVLFDEIGDMSPALQAKLLRVLDERTFRRRSGARDIRVDVRIVACTHENLERLVDERKFREDLYYRLNAITIDVPPLRERPEDLVPLTDHFLRHLARDLERSVSGISTQARQKLQAHDWPGNVRELKGVLERALVLGPAPALSADDIVLGRHATTSPGQRLLTLPQTGLDLADLDRDLVLQAFARAKGNQTKAAGLLGITRDKLHYRLEKYCLLRRPDRAPG